MRWYKDRDFPEVKVSNADIIAVIENPKQLQRVIDEHNAVLDRIWELEKEVTDIRNYHDSKDQLWRKAVVERSELKSKLDKAAEALEKISDPRKRDHKEPDAYTTLGCVMSIADSALADIRKEE
jgi:hypothetical protein